MAGGDEDVLICLDCVSGRYSAWIDQHGVAGACEPTGAMNYTPATLRSVIDHIDQVQNTLGRQMLLENPATPR
jgi:uncharacterized protein (UPF0276 family)